MMVTLAGGPYDGQDMALPNVPPAPVLYATQPDADVRAIGNARAMPGQNIIYTRRAGTLIYDYTGQAA
jgi:hypothetical protein